MPPRHGQRCKSPAKLDFYREFYAAHCGAPVLPVLPKAKCGRRLRPSGAKGTLGVPFLFSRRESETFGRLVFCEVKTQVVGKTKFVDRLDRLLAIFMSA